MQAASCRIYSFATGYGNGQDDVDFVDTGMQEAEALHIIEHILTSEHCRP